MLANVSFNPTRFSLNMDIAAPKITIPTKFRPDDVHETKLLLDLGNLVLRTEVVSLFASMILS
jgi:vacuolar protein sorting-associated protein 13A/C